MHAAPVTFAKQSAPLSFDKSLGLCFGWFAFEKRGGEVYVDAHGDVFPGVELLKAVDALMAKPAAEREINVEHQGGARGVIATAHYLGEDVAKAMGIDTGGNYGIVGSFRPDAELLKSIQAGEMFCLSIEGRASDVEHVAKTADGAIAATAHRRTMRGVELTKLAVVKLGAHEGAAVAIIKTAQDAARSLVASRVAKRQHALTSVENGHQHVVYDADDTDTKAGTTSWEPGEEGGHVHSWIRTPAGIEIAASGGHTHYVLAAGELEKNVTMSTAPDLSKQLADAQADLAKARRHLAAAIALPAEQAAYAKTLTGAALEVYLDAPDAERIAKAAPLYKSATTGEAYFAGDPRIALAKALDAQALELAAEREAAKLAGFAKTASQIASHVTGGPAAGIALAKAIAGVSLTDEERQLATTALTAANAVMKSTTQPVGHGHSVATGSALEAYERGLEAFAKSRNKTPDEVADDFLSDPNGQRLYAAYDAETAAARRIGPSA